MSGENKTLENQWFHVVLLHTINANANTGLLYLPFSLHIAQDGGKNLPTSNHQYIKIGHHLTSAQYLHSSDLLQFHQCTIAVLWVQENYWLAMSSYLWITAQRADVMVLQIFDSFLYVVDFQADMMHATSLVLVKEVLNGTLISHRVQQLQGTVLRSCLCSRVFCEWAGLLLLSLPAGLALWRSW